VIAVLAILAVSEEYGTGMIRVTLSAMPRRLTLLAANAANLAGLTLPAGTPRSRWDDAGSADHRRHELRPVQTLPLLLMRKGDLEMVSVDPNIAAFICGRPHRAATWWPPVSEAETAVLAEAALPVLRDLLGSAAAFRT
jgi:hypothetical protein